MTQTATPPTLSQLPDLVALRVSNGALKGEQLPTRIKVLAWGDNPSTKGVFKVGPRTLQVLQANQAALGFDRVAIDYNHASAPGAPDYVKGAVPPVLGYGRVSVVENDGVYLEDVTWTPLGLQHARNFEDLSPALHPNEPGREVEFIHSVALTTNGALRDVSFFSAKTTTEDKSMSTQNVLTLALLACALELPETATADQVADGIKKLKQLQRLEPLSALVKDGKLLIPELTTLSEMKARVESDLVKLQADVVKLSEQITAMKAGAEGDERNKIVALFSAEGKVPKNAEGKAYTAEELAKLDVPTLKLLHANTPSTVPLTARGKTPQEGKQFENLKGLEKAIAAHKAGQ